MSFAVELELRDRQPHGSALAGTSHSSEARPSSLTLSPNILVDLTAATTLYSSKKLAFHASSHRQPEIRSYHPSRAHRTLHGLRDRVPLHLEVKVPRKEPHT